MALEEFCLESKYFSKRENIDNSFWPVRRDLYRLIRTSVKPLPSNLFFGSRPTLIFFSKPRAQKTVQLNILATGF